MTAKYCAIGAFVMATLGAAAINGAHGAELTPGKIFQDCAHCPEMVVVPAGTVKAGDPKDYDRDDDPERPSLSFDRPFAIGRFEMTQAQWEAVMGNNPSRNKNPALPVEKVRFVDVLEFISRLNAKTGKQYRLPTEAEWEYAARAGSNAAYSFGDDAGELGKYAWFKSNSGETTQPGGKLRPNAFGLYDMHGNVWEWTNDCYGSSYAAMLPSDFAKEREAHCYRVIRGGSIYNFPKYLTAFHRASLTPVNSDANLGFRLALSLP
jgi:formylglycine-generating enzyme required for sulfatase activity